MSAMAGAPTIGALRWGAMPSAAAVGDPVGHQGATEVRPGQPGASVPSARKAWTSPSLVATTSSSPGWPSRLANTGLEVEAPATARGYPATRSGSAWT
jgi:hypothetical protein